MTAKQKEMLKNRMRSFYQELSNMLYIISCAQGALDKVDSNTNLTKEIGVLVRDFPKFNTLEPQANWFKATIRKVCSGEVEPSEASKMLEASYQEILELRECFNTEELFSTVVHVPAQPVNQD